MRPGALDQGIASLFPGYFALVMATGIVSVAADLTGLPWIPEALLVVGGAAYAVLWALTIVRLVRHPRRMLEDLNHHGRSPGFFTLVAGTCVLGSQVYILTGDAPIPWALWILGIALWAFLIYAFFTAVTVARVKPSVESGLNGAWLIAIVATQSVAILGTLLADELAPGTPRQVQLFFCLTMYLIGCLLYLPVITIIIYRFTFFPLPVEGLSPPYWINMGAVAITTLAGSSLMLVAPGWAFLDELEPFLRGFTLFFWAGATWWIPLLVALGFWRHAVRRHPLTYDPQYWGLVFPLGMYTACTWQLSRALELPFLLAVPRAFVFVALAAWTLTLLGLARSLVRAARA